MKIISLVGVLEDTAKVQAQSGWQLHFLDLLVNSEGIRDVHPSWNYVSKTYVRYILFYALSSQRVQIVFQED